MYALLFVQFCFLFSLVYFHCGIIIQLLAVCQIVTEIMRWALNGGQI